MNRSLKQSVFLFAVVIVGLSGCNKKTEEVQDIIEEKDDIEVVEKEVSKNNEEVEKVDEQIEEKETELEWKTYRNDEYRFEFEHIGVLTLDKYINTENPCEPFVSWNIFDDEYYNDVMLSSLSLYDEDSVKNCRKKEDGPFPPLSFITPEVFTGQKENLNKGLSYQDIKVTYINKRPFYIKMRGCEDSCGFEYVTYINDTRLSFYVAPSYDADFYELRRTNIKLFSEKLRKKTDKLIEKMEIKEIK